MFAHFDWVAAPFFKSLTARNRLCRDLGMQFANVSGLAGFEEAIAAMQQARGFVCVSESSDGVSRLDYSPNVRRFKTVFLALRHAENDMEARNRCLSQIREVFRQFLSYLSREKERLHAQAVYLADEIPFHEIERYFASGCACAYFQLEVTTSADLRYNPAEWEPVE